MLLKNKYISDDKTIKYEFYVKDSQDEVIESCLLSLEKHGTVICISSQIGCQQRCHFCAAGSKPFIRNATVDELSTQVSHIINDKPEYFEGTFQITYMGAGEPLGNFGVIIESMGLFCGKYEGLSKINISTVLPSLEIDVFAFSEFKNKVHFQYSLHFTDDVRRKRYFREQLPSIKDSLKLLERLAHCTNDIYSINYLLLDGINDSDSDAICLSKLSSPSAYIKVSELCKIDGLPFYPSNRCDEFVKVLESQKVKYERFSSLGTDVNAGCGQFYNDSII